MSDFNSSPYDEFDLELDKPPPNKKYRVTPINEYTDSDLLPPTILGTLLPIDPPPEPETKESIQKLLAPYKSKIPSSNTRHIPIHHPRISVTKHKNKNKKPTKQQIIHINSITSSTTISKASSESIINGYITVYDIPDSCWSLTFHFCTVEDLVFNIASTNKFFQTLVIDTSTWIHRRVVLPSKIYTKTLKQKVQNTLESIFLNWTSLKQLDIMIAPETDSNRLTFMWRLLCTPRPKIEILRIGNSISLPGGDISAVNENAFKYLKLITDIQVIDFSFNMFSISYDSIIDFFAAQAGQIYAPPPKPKKSYLSQWNANNKNKNENENKNNTNSNAKNINNSSGIDRNLHVVNESANSNNKQSANNNSSTVSIINTLDEIECIQQTEEVLNDDSITPLPSFESDAMAGSLSPNAMAIRSKSNSPKHKKRRRIIHQKTNVISKSVTPERIVSNNENNNSNSNVKSPKKKHSILGKRTRERSPIDSLSNTPKNKKLKRSEKREIDSDNECKNNNNNNNNMSIESTNSNSLSPIKGHTMPKYFRKRKRRRTSDSCLIQPKKSRSINDNNINNNNNKSELSPNKKMAFQKRKFHKRRANVLSPSMSIPSTPNHRISKRPNIRKRVYNLHKMNNMNSPTKQMDTVRNENWNKSISSSVSIKKEVSIPQEFNVLSCTPSPITSPILNENAFNLSIYGKQKRKTILSNIDPSLMNTLKDLNNEELELNLSLTFNINSIDIGLNNNNNNRNMNNDNDEYYESYRENLHSDYAHIDKKKDEMKDLGCKSKLRRIYFRELCMKSFPDLAYNYLNINCIESLSLYTGDTSSLIAFIDKCGKYPLIKKIEIDGTSPFRWRCAPLCEALTKCINLCSIQLPSIVDAVDIIAFDSFINAAVNLTEIGLVTGDRQLFKPIHDVIHKHGFKMDINPSGLRFIFARRKNKPKLREKYYKNKQQFLQRTRNRSNTY